MKEWGRRKGVLRKDIIDFEAHIDRLRSFEAGDPLGLRREAEAELHYLREFIYSYAPHLTASDPLVIVGGSILWGDWRKYGNKISSSDIDILCTGERELTLEERKIIYNTFEQYEKVRGIDVGLLMRSIPKLEQSAELTYTNPINFVTVTRASIATVHILTGNPLFPTPENVSAQTALRIQVKSILLRHNGFRQNVLEGIQKGIEKRMDRRGR